MSPQGWISNIWVSEAFAQAQTGSGGQSGAPSFSFFVPLLLVFVIFYFLMIRPQQKQQKDRQKMIAALKKGDTIITTSGIHGRVTGIADKILTVEIGDNVKIKLDRDAVATVKTTESTPS
jgi:preprotein translocase subunit YajC